MRERKSNRLRDYDYSERGYYFVTICTKDRKKVFGDVEEGKMNSNRCGEIVSQCWSELPGHYLNCSLDSFIVMPNHVHGIVVINDKNDVGNGSKPFPRYGLSEIMRGFKTSSSRKINEEINESRKFQWQKSFYDHIIRNERSLENIRAYILYNPLKWEFDIENIDNFSPDKSLKDYYEKIIDGR